jgi:hypothetical protein
MVVHVCSPGSLGGRGRRVVRPAWTKVVERDPVFKKMGVRGWRKWLKCQSTCLASVRPWVQTTVLQKQNNNKTFVERSYISRGKPGIKEKLLSACIRREKLRDHSYLSQRQVFCFSFHIYVCMYACTLKNSYGPW